jgi:cell division protein FtsX
MLRAVLYAVRAGVADLRRAPVLVSVCVVTVGLATSLALAAPALSELVAVGGAEAVSGSEVIVFVSTNLDVGEIPVVERQLESLVGVDHLRDATADDLAATLTGFEVGADISSAKTLVLDGSLAQSSVLSRALGVHGVEKAEAGVGMRVGWAISLLELVVPWLAALFAVAAVILVANLAFATARTRRDEAHVMRLVGAGWMSIWFSLGTVVVLPVVATVLSTSVAWALAWPRLLESLVSPHANGVVPATSFMRTGIGLTFIAAATSAGLTQLALLPSKR